MFPDREACCRPMVEHRLEAFPRTFGELTSVTFRTKPMRELKSAAVEANLSEVNEEKNLDSAILGAAAATCATANHLG